MFQWRSALMTVLFQEHCLHCQSSLDFSVLIKYNLLMNDEEYKTHFKYKAIKAMIKKSMKIKTPDAVSWRRSARRYLNNFEQQYTYRNLPTWKLDDEIFDRLQREAQSLMLEL